MRTWHDYSKSGLAFTEGFEGLRLTAYQDQGGVWTIGYGHTLGVIPGKTITQLQAEMYLLQDIQSAVGVVNNLVTIDLTQNEFDALVDFVFNVGSGNFRTSTLLKKLNANDITGAALEFDKWDHDKGKVVAGLLRRRQNETEEFDGNSTISGTGNLSDSSKV